MLDIGSPHLKKEGQEKLEFACFMLGLCGRNLTSVAAWSWIVNGKTMFKDFYLQKTSKCVCQQNTWVPLPVIKLLSCLSFGECSKVTGYVQPRNWCWVLFISTTGTGVAERCALVSILYCTHKMHTQSGIWIESPPYWMVVW